ncbi:MAG: hypothetical protein CUN54_10495, partial [Phototrophicales bacterium]
QQDIHIEIILPPEGFVVTNEEQTRWFAVAYDPLVGMENGDGIDVVEFEIRNLHGATLYTRTEESNPRCVFSNRLGQTQCLRMSDTSANLYNQLGNGRYILRAKATANDGTMSVWDERSFIMA